MAFRPAFDVVDWEEPKKQVKAASHSDGLHDFKLSSVDNRVEIFLVDDVSEVYRRELFNDWLQLGKEGVFVFVEGEDEADAAAFVLLEDGFGNLKGLKMVGHKHKGKAEEDESKFEFEVFLNSIEVQIVDFNLLVSLKQSNGLLSILRMQIDSNYLRVKLFDGFYDSLKRFASSTAHIKEVS